MNTRETSRRIITLLTKQVELFGDDLPARIILRVDTTGGDVGVGVADRVAELLAPFGNVELQTIGAKETPFDPRKYQNKRSEIWFTAASWAQAGLIDLSRIPKRKREVLTSQLLAATFKYDSPGRRIVEPKKDIKERIGRSPDDADAFNLAWYVRGREYKSVDYNVQDLQKTAVWNGPPGEINWGHSNERGGETRSWTVGTSTGRRFL